MYTDETLVCKDCGNEFVFSSPVNEFYARRASERAPPLQGVPSDAAEPATAPLLPVAPLRDQFDARVR